MSSLDTLIKEHVKLYNKEYYLEHKDVIIDRAKKRYKDLTPEQLEARKLYRRNYWLKNKK